MTVHPVPVPLNPSPAAARSRTPSWLTVRSALGTLLVLVSIVTGSALAAAADRSARVWSVTADLAAGTTLDADDVVVIEVRLFDQVDRYLPADRSPTGSTLARDLGRGELLPVDALGGDAGGSLVSIPVDAQHVPESLRTGQRIDVYATAERTATTERVLAGVAVQEVRRPAGGLTSAGGGITVVVRVPAGQVGPVVTAVRTAAIDIVVLDGPPSGEPSAAPAAPVASTAPTAPAESADPSAPR